MQIKNVEMKQVYSLKFFVSYAFIFQNYKF